MACGLSAFTKEIGASAEEYGGNYMLASSRPLIFGELFPSHNESIEFVEWNRDALKAMDAVFAAKPPIEHLEEIMSIKSQMFDNFRQDRIESEKIIEEMMEIAAAKAKDDAEKKRLAEQGNGRNNRPIHHAARNDGNLPTKTRTFDEYHTQPSSQTQADRSRWSGDTTQTYRPPQRRQEDDYVPKSPPPKPANNNGWQTVSKGRKPNAWGK